MAKGITVSTKLLEELHVGLSTFSKLTKKQKSTKQLFINIDNILLKQKFSS